MKAFVENNKIFITPEDNLIPQGAISIDVPEGTQLDELEWNEQNLILKSQEQIQAEKLLKIKQEKLKQISQLFETTIANGHFFSQSLQIEVDCRRSSTKNDLENVKNLIEAFIEINRETLDIYRGYTVPDTGETYYAHNVTLNQLKQLKLEMIQYGENLYRRKWSLEDLINNAQTLEELNSINIDFENL